MWTGKPALFAAIVMAAGFGAARLAGQPPALWAACTSLCFVPSLIRLLRLRSVRSSAVCFSLSIPLLLFCASALWYAITLTFETDHITQYLHLGRPVRIVARVVEEPVLRAGRTHVVVDVAALSLPAGGETRDGAGSAADSAAVTGRALLTVIQDRGKAGGADDTLNFSYGDMVAFTGMLEEPQDTRNPGEVSYRDYLAIGGVYAAARVRGFHAITVISRNPSWLYERLIFPAKHFAARAIRTAAGGDEANYLTGLLLGDRSDLSKEIQKAFADTGTMHVLAVSGSHVVVIVAAIYALFGMLRIPTRARTAATIVAVLFYMLLTGAAPAVVRASLMTSVVLGGRLLRRQATVYNCLGASAVLMFVIDPVQIFDVGFQLSFAAVLAMVFFYPRLTAWTRVIPRTTLWGRIAAAAVDITAISAAAQIGTIPFTAYYFEKVSLISLFANLFVVPLAGLNITIGFVSVLISAVSGWIGSCFTEVNQALAHWVLASVKAANRIPFAIVHTPAFGAAGTAFYLLITAMVFNFTRPAVFRKLFLVLFFAADCLLIRNALAHTSNVMRVTFFDVGQGDAALVEFPGGGSMMVDAGPRSEQYDAGEKVIVPGLRRRGIGHLSALLVTHLHDDHAGGAASLLSGIGADRLIVPWAPGVRTAGLLRAGTGAGSGSVLFSHASALGALRLPEAGTRFAVHAAQRGERLAVHPDARIYVLSAGGMEGEEDDAYAAANNSSVVVKLCYGRVSFLLMGDAERTVEREMAERYGDFLRCTVVKLGHHGSRTSSSEELLRASAPREAVISVGRFNAFRHPSPSTLRRLRQMDVRMHRTDREGAVVYETDGETLRLLPWRDDARRRGLLR